MASALYQIWLTIFAKKPKKNVYFWPYDFVQNSPASDPVTYRMIYEKIVDFLCHVSLGNGNIKCPIEKWFVAINYIKSNYIKRVKNLPYHRCKCLHWKSKVWNLNKIVWSEIYESLSFLTENRGFKAILTKNWRLLERIFWSWNNCWILNY